MGIYGNAIEKKKHHEKIIFTEYRNEHIMAKLIINSLYFTPVQCDPEVTMFFSQKQTEKRGMFLITKDSI